MLWGVFLLFREFQLWVVGGGFTGFCLGEVWCLFLHFDRLRGSAIPVRRVVVHGVVRGRRELYEAARREFKWLRS